MPFCTTCGSPFEGRGNHCTLHNPYLQNYYSSDSSDPISVRYRTGRFPSSANRQPRNPTRKITWNDDYDPYDTYGRNSPNTLISYSPRSSLSTLPYNSGGGDPMTSPSTLRPLTTTFSHLSTTHAVTSLTYTVQPNGTRSITATANPDREQCAVCMQWFPDHRKLEMHMWEFPVGCEVHGVCMRDDDVSWHAQERHGRCFVRGCESVYRREGSWKRGVVEGHVRRWHG